MTKTIQTMKKVVVSSLIFLLIGTALGYGVGWEQQQKVLAGALDIIHPLRENNASYAFINPLLAYIIPSADQQDDFRVLKNQVVYLIDSEKKRGSIQDASVFFSDLNHGRWIGIGENNNYNPASILKVVIMTIYFKEREANPDILRSKLQYIDDIDRLIRQEAYGEKSKLEAGKLYAIEDLINAMIIDSDNGATILLLANINQRTLNELYAVLGIENAEETMISPRAYSLFFRILYSATYLSKSMSEQALSLLSKTTFREGIVAGLPERTVVAHKFGEHIQPANGGIGHVELHDCGIVYTEKSPYFLCVMTKGKNIEPLKGVIKNISGLVYRNYKSTK